MLTDKAILVGLEIINKLIDLEVQLVTSLDEAGKRRWAEDRLADRELWERFNPFRWLDKAVRGKPSDPSEVGG